MSHSATPLAPLPTAESRPAADPKWWTLTAVCLGVFMLLLDVTIVNVALPDIQDELSATLSDLQWVIDAYALSLASLLLTAGSLADLYGRKRVYVVGLVLFTVGSVACGAAQDINLLTWARAFQGIGGAAMFATALALLASAFRGKDRGVAFGVFGAVTGVAVAVGPVLGGVLTSGLSWRWIFFVNIPVAAVAIAVTRFKVVESHNPRAGRPDWFGFVTFTLALAGLVYGLIEAGQRSWTDQRVVWSLGAAAVLLVVFLVSQAVVRHPMFDLALLRKPTFVGGLIAAFAISGTIFSLLAYLVIYVQNVLDYSPVATGVRFLFLSGASFFAAAISGRLSSHVPVKWLIGPGFVVLAVGLYLLLGIEPDSSWTHLIPGLLVSGVAVGMINAPLASTAVGVVEPARSGMASGVNSTFRQVGIATGVAALGSIFAQQVGDAVRPQLEGKVPARAADGLTAALSGGQVHAAAEGAQKAATASGNSQQAFDLVNRIGTAAVVDALNHTTTIAMVGAAVAAVFSLLLIRQRDFVPQGGPPQGGPDQGGSGEAGSSAGLGGTPDGPTHRAEPGAHAAHGGDGHGEELHPAGRHAR